MFKFLKKKELELLSPITGKMVEITEVPDPVFAEKMIGDGVAIEPTDGMVLAPCQGKVVQVFPTNHAVGIEIERGIDLLIHVGIDTVEMQGDGFERLIQEGERVSIGTPLLKMDIEKINSYGKHTITPVIITTMDKIQKLDIATGNVRAGKDVVMKVKIK